MALTDLKIKNLKPRDKAYKVADFDGLFVSVQPTGSRLFRFKYRVDGKEGFYHSVGIQMFHCYKHDKSAMMRGSWLLLELIPVLSGKSQRH